jgi:hypothetical protein
MKEYKHTGPGQIVKGPNYIYIVIKIYGGPDNDRSVDVFACSTRKGSVWGMSHCPNHISGTERILVE